MSAEFVMKKGSKRVTLDIVAKEAGVSTSTVSLCLHNDPRISDSTKKRVLKVARALNYVPNLAARELAGKNSLSIGMVLPKFADPNMCMSLFQGAEEHAYDNGHIFLISFSHNDLKREAELVNYLIGKNIEGLVLWPLITKDYSSNSEMLQQVSRRVPMVFVDHYLDEFECNYVVTDNFGAIYKAMKFLLERGHRDIAFLGSCKYCIGKERYQGYLRALEVYNIPLREELISLKFREFHSKGAYLDTIEAMFSLERRPTALVSWSRWGIEAFCELVRSGRLNDVENVDVVGVDLDYVPHGINASIVSHIYTILQPHYEMGRKACEILMDSINSGVDTPRLMRLEAEIMPITRFEDREA